MKHLNPMLAVLVRYVGRLAKAAGPGLGYPTFLPEAQLHTSPGPGTKKDAGPIHFRKCLVMGISARYDMLPIWLIRRKYPRRSGSPSQYHVTT
jgi:hypothetical protein